MAGAVPKITLSSSRDIPFNKLVLSPVECPAREGRHLDRRSWPRTSRGARCCKASTFVRFSTPMARRPACSKYPPVAAAIARSNSW